jgi:hypothetical protein
MRTVEIAGSFGETVLSLTLAVAPNARDFFIRRFAALSFNLFTSALSALTIFSSVLILAFFDMVPPMRFPPDKHQRGWSDPRRILTIL